MVKKHSVSQNETKCVSVHVALCTVLCVATLGILGCNQQSPSRAPATMPSESRPEASPEEDRDTAGTLGAEQGTSETAPAGSPPVTSSLEGSPLDSAPLPADTSALPPAVVRNVAAARPTFVQGIDAQSSLSCSLAQGIVLQTTSEPQPLAQSGAANATESDTIVVSFVAPQGCPLTRGSLFRSHWTGF